jgi:hypothetical protein
MPLYLVRWPFLRASIVLARKESHLVSMIDEMVPITSGSRVR